LRFVLGRYREIDQLVDRVSRKLPGPHSGSFGIEFAAFGLGDEDLVFGTLLLPVVVSPLLELPFLCCDTGPLIA
jgi:hypothetical protein